MARRIAIVLMIVSLALLPGPPGGALAAPSVRLHTSEADFRGGSAGPGFRASDYRGGALTLAPQAQGLGAWAEAGASRLPATLYEHQLVALDRWLFVSGGETAQGATAAVLRAQLGPGGQLSAWQPMPALPQPLLRHAAVAAGRSIVVLGGIRARLSSLPLDTVYQATVGGDGQLSAWHSQPALPVGLAKAAAVALGGFVFVLGGLGPDGQRQASAYAAPLAADGGLGAWFATTPLPVPLSEHAAAAAGRCIFVAGGESDSGNPRSEVFSAQAGEDGRIGAWQNLAGTRLPEVLNSFTLTAAAGQLVAIGGESGAPAYDRSEVYRAEIRADCTLGAWSNMTSAAMPYELVDHAAAAVEGQIVVAGGHLFGNSVQYDRVYQARMLAADPARSWASAPPLDQALAGPAAVLHGDYIYLLGGQGAQGPRASVRRAALRPDGSLGAWVPMPDLPAPLRGHAAAAIGRSMLVLGGNDGANDRDTIYQAEVGADGSLGAWSMLPCRLPGALTGHAVVVVGNVVYLSGGRNGFAERDQVYALATSGGVPSGCWREVSRLPGALARHAMAASGGYLFVSGGITGGGGDALDTVYRAEIGAGGQLGAWAELAENRLPKYLYGHAMVAAGEQLFVLGGRQPFSLVAEPRVYEARMGAGGSLGEWHELSQLALPQALANLAALATDQQLLVLGGDNGGLLSASVYRAAFYQGARQAEFVHQFDLGGDQDIGELSWLARGDPGASLRMRFRVAPGATARFGAWSEPFASSPAPIYERGRFVQYQLLAENPDGGVKTIDEVRLTHGAIGNYVRVLDEQGRSVPGAAIYLNGALAGVTGQRGILTPEHLPRLAEGDRLVALSQAAERGTVRAAHSWPGDTGPGWAYRVYTTNIAVAGDVGELRPDLVGQPGGQQLTVRAGRPLILFNLLISIEWAADADYTREISQAARLASDYLIDISEGQMALGHVAIYTNAERWDDADIQISAKNVVRPHAYIGGLTDSDPSHVLRVGRRWNGRTGNEGPWDQPDGYRTLVHEFGHYALYLYDEYFAYRYDAGGNLVGTRRRHCTGVGNRLPAGAETAATIMDYQYTTSELAMRGVPGLWSEECELTAQTQLNAQQSDWETIARRYGDSQQPPRWRVTTPLDRGRVLAGPAGMPSNVLPFPVVELKGSGPKPPARELLVRGSQGSPYWGALVALYTNQQGRPVAIDQGLTDWQGTIAIYGAQSGDTVQVASLDGGLSGRVSITAAHSYTLDLAPPPRRRLLAQAGQPAYLLIWPASDGRSLNLSLHGLGPGGTLMATVTQPGGTASASTIMTYSGGQSAYLGELAFDSPDAQPGTGSVQVLGVSDNSRGVSFSSTYALQRLPAGHPARLHSADGNISAYFITDTFAVDAYALLAPASAAPAAPPAGRLLAGNAYSILPSGAQNTSARPFLLALHYDPEVLRGDLIGPQTLLVYRWQPGASTGEPGAWVPLASTWNPDDHSVSAAASRFGIYALMGYRSAHYFFLPVARP